MERHGVFTARWIYRCSRWFVNVRAGRRGGRRTRAARRRGRCGRGRIRDKSDERPARRRDGGHPSLTFPMVAAPFAFCCSSQIWATAGHCVFFAIMYRNVAGMRVALQAGVNAAGWRKAALPLCSLLFSHSTAPYPRTCELSAREDGLEGRDLMRSGAAWGCWHSAPCGLPSPSIKAHHLLGPRSRRQRRWYLPPRSAVILYQVRDAGTGAAGDGGGTAYLPALRLLVLNILAGSVEHVTTGVAVYRAARSLVAFCSAMVCARLYRVAWHYWRHGAAGISLRHRGHLVVPGLSPLNIASPTTLSSLLSQKAPR
jgi:hypothetical protein